MGQRTTQSDDAIDVAHEREQNRRLAPRTLALAALLAVVTVVAYLPSIQGGFLLDDNELLTENPIVRSSDGLYQFWCTTHADDYWPMTNSSFWLEWRLWGMNPTGYHVTNLVLHIAAALLVWAILRKFSLGGAYLAALLFAVHPVNVESVAWISQRKNTLAIVFFLLSILWYLKAEEEARRGGEKEIRQNSRWGIWYGLSLAAFVLAMLSKGSVAVLPVMLLLGVWWQQGQVSIRDFLRTIPFFVIAIVLTGVNVWFQKHGMNIVVRDVDFWQRLAGAAGAVWFYLSKALAPIDLIFVYPQWQIDVRQLVWWLPLTAAAVLTLVLLERQWRQRSALAAPHDWARGSFLAWLFFCVALVPVLGFTDVGFMRYSLVADHYEYIAILGVAAWVAAGWDYWHRHNWGTARQAAVAAAVIGVGVLCCLTWQQNEDYSNAISLYQSTLKGNPTSWAIHNAMGVALEADGKMPAAIEHYQRAIKIQPNDARGYYNLGNAITKVGRTPEAIEQFQTAIKLAPNYAQAENNLGAALANEERFEEAAEHFRNALQIRPNFPEAHNNLGMALSRLGKLDEAIEQSTEAARVNPDFAEAYDNLGMFYSAKGETVRAISEFQRSLELNPNSSNAHGNFGTALALLGRTKDAAQQFLIALRLNSTNWDAAKGLTTAYAKMEDPAAAIATAKKAIQIAQSQGRNDMVEQFDRWLTDYQNHAASAPAK